MNSIQFNKFSDLHGNNSTIFCKTDFILEEFTSISLRSENFTLITGNADYAVTDKLVEICPKNISRWYGLNVLSKNSKLFPIPLGLENKLPATRAGHGIGYYDRVSEKEFLISQIPKNNDPKKLIYANFNIHTNIKHRLQIAKISAESKHIDWEEPKLTLSQLFERFIDYKMVLCPIGNGVDTHRLWETLYCNKIPVTIKAGNYKIYELYSRFPIVVLDDMAELRDHNILSKKYDEQLNKNFDKQLLDIEYWKEIIANNEYI